MNFFIKSILITTILISTISSLVFAIKNIIKYSKDTTSLSEKLVVVLILLLSTTLGIVTLINYIID